MRSILRSAIPMILIGNLAACEMPNLPEWDVTNRAAVAADTIGIQEFAPASIPIELDQFVFPISTVRDSASIGDLCGYCSRYEGQEWPYPAFNYTRTMQAYLPPELIETSLSHGVLIFSLSHNLPYSLFRSDRGTTGYVMVALKDPDGRTLAADTVHGTENAAPPGQAVRIILNLRNVRITPGVWMEMSLYSPGSGNAYPMYNVGKFVFQADLTALRARTATVTQGGISFGNRVIEIPLASDQKRQLIGRLVRGSLTLDLTYPFTAPAGLEVGLAASREAARRGEWVASARRGLVRGDNRYVIMIDEEQMERLLSGSGIFLGTKGMMPAGPLTLRPTDRLTYKAVLEADYTINKK